MRNIESLSRQYRVIAPDLRGHGQSDKPRNGYHVFRLAMDLRELLIHVVGGEQELASTPVKAIVGSLGCAVLWFEASFLYYSLHTTNQVCS